MRDIKFRVWIKIAQQMASWDEIVQQKNLHRLIDNGEYPLMQFTGLTDKNCVDIYEGDIVTFTFEEKIIGVIQWDEEFAGFEILTNATYYCLDFNHAIEIIGNIHQHKHLLGG